MSDHLNFLHKILRLRFIIDASFTFLRRVHIIKKNENIFRGGGWSTPISHVFKIQVHLKPVQINAVCI